jgi:hypothetical protein
VPRSSICQFVAGLVITTFIYFNNLMDEIIEMCEDLQQLLLIWERLQTQECKLWGFVGGEDAIEHSAMLFEHYTHRDIPEVKEEGLVVSKL